MEYTTELIAKESVAEGTMAFHFRKPEGFAFKAGQYMDVTLIDPSETDAEGNTRSFSIVAAPSEDRLTLATRMRDTAFKRVLGAAIAGFKVSINGPMGSFTLHEKADRPAIMLVGGIGITPFMSMLKHATEHNLPHAIYLFYSNRRPEDAAFLDELMTLQQENKNIVLVPTMTAMDASQQPWEGETGYITASMIAKHVPDRANAVYYTAGPLAMVTAMRTILSGMDISDDDIKTEEFPGY